MGAFHASESNSAAIVPIKGTVAGSSSLTNFLYLIIVGLVLGHGGQSDVATRSQGEARTGAHGAHGSRLAGEWVATGHVRAYGMSNRSTGEVLRRRWIFGTVCKRTRCRTDFSRTDASSEISTAVLRLHGDYYTAAFPRISDGCEERPGWFADFAGDFTLRWSKGRTELHAMERGFFPGGGGCGPAAETIRWTARLRRGRPLLRGT